MLTLAVASALVPLERPRGRPVRHAVNPLASRAPPGAIVATAAERGSRARIRRTPRLGPSQRELVRRLLEHVRDRSGASEERRVFEAFRFSYRFHRAQFRQSGEPYITHPLEVATMLAELEMDSASIQTGLLHDTVEDTGATLDDLSARFGDEVAALVDGVTKLDRPEMRQVLAEPEPEDGYTTDQTQGENLRKLVHAMSDDIRVLVVKLVDRLHNMRTLDYVTSQKSRHKKASETLQIYAPLAERIGLFALRGELQTLAFGELYPDEAAAIAAQRQRLRVAEPGGVGEVCAELAAALEEHAVRGAITVRDSSPYRVWLRLAQRGQPPTTEAIERLALRDLFQFVLVVDDRAACYQALGVVHERWRALGDFKDYISTPKPNLYQSLHTTVLGPAANVIDVQIRTRAMNRTADLGLLANWERHGRSALRNDSRWLRSLRGISDAATRSESYIEATRMELYPDQIFCFTPQGDLIQMPRGSTALDFAYAVHTGLGNHCVGASVNGRSLSIHSGLRNGDLVEILTDPCSGPPPEWEQLVVSGKARSEIQRHNLNRQREAAARRGRATLERLLEAAYAPVGPGAWRRRWRRRLLWPVRTTARVVTAPFGSGPRRWRWRWRLGAPPPLRDADVMAALLRLPDSLAGEDALVCSLSSVQDVFLAIDDGQVEPRELVDVLLSLPPRGEADDDAKGPTGRRPPTPPRPTDALAGDAAFLPSTAAAAAAAEAAASAAAFNAAAAKTRARPAGRNNSTSER